MTLFLALMVAFVAALMAALMFGLLAFFSSLFMGLFLGFFLMSLVCRSWRVHIIRKGYLGRIHSEERQNDHGQDFFHRFFPLISFMFSNKGYFVNYAKYIPPAVMRCAMLCPVQSFEMLF